MEQHLKFTKTLVNTFGKYTYSVYIPISKISFISSTLETNSLKIYTIDQNRQKDIPAFTSNVIMQSQFESLLEYAANHSNQPIISLYDIGVSIEDIVDNTNKQKSMEYDE